jgi:hypothetical protein
VAVRAGGWVTRRSFSQFVRQHEAGLRRLLHVFPAGHGTAPLYGNGRNSDLLGESVDSTARAAAVGARLRLDSDDVFASFRPGARLVPSFISGVIEGHVRPGESVAVAIDGTVRGVTETFSDEDGVRIAAIVPSASFKAGSNSVEVFLVRGEGPARRLAPVQTQRPESYRLAGDTITGGGRNYRVEKGRIEGFIDGGSSDDQAARLRGWAVDTQGPVPAKLILAFLDGRLVAKGGIAEARPDIVADFGTPAVLKCGFQLRAEIPRSDIPDVRVFAVSKEAATELVRFRG